ncbi:uncharacterized protein BYT42DRAFT_565865 [Radiomyces spectabilis]|uniref:uncharacterized protein n=1 Tax=Radiomyces spectabilis TaxID=64574 RepID=UPI00221E72DE|nr:uncharacterized protein BYT42DRAFT_565865 [Radiomyces spectabilis]KAI8381253.1 hypothetical protein BYT42DRAFT_565865 [Radiomyces spectabilis]
MDEFNNVDWDDNDKAPTTHEDAPAVFDPLSDMTEALGETLPSAHSSSHDPHEEIRPTLNFSTTLPLETPNVLHDVFDDTVNHADDHASPAEASSSSSSQPYYQQIHETKPKQQYQIAITEPRKENDGQQGTYISYNVQSNKAIVRRRFQDFVWLHNVLFVHYPACFVPPLPDKHRMEYVKGDRFSKEFIERRRVSLERFLMRIARHPILGKSEFFVMFLESPGFNDASARSLREGQETVMDTLGDSLLNAFAKIRKPDQRFIDMREHIHRLEENLALLEKTLARTNKRTEDLSHDYEEFAECIRGLADLETNITPIIQQFADANTAYASNMKELSVHELNWLGEIHDYMAYYNVLKGVLKLRDQKQLDFEELTDYLQSSIKEREKMIQPRHESYNITGYFTDKLNEVRGADTEKVRREKMLRLDDRIRELQEAIKETNQVSNAFSDQVQKEDEYFAKNQRAEMHDVLKSYTDAKVDFYQKGADLWRDIVQALENEQQ